VDLPPEARVDVRGGTPIDAADAAPTVDEVAADAAPTVDEVAADAAPTVDEVAVQEVPGDTPQVSAGDTPQVSSRDEPPVAVDARVARPAHAWLPGVRSALPLLLILAVAAILRVYGYNWDQGTNLHPDERGIVGPIRGIGLPHSWAEFWSPASPLNPHFAAYGHLPFYATTIFAHVLGWLGRTIGGPLGGLSLADVTDTGIIQSGRVLSGLADTGTLLFVYLIGRQVYGRAVGLLAALLGAFTVLNLEFAHFANVDTYLTFCTTGALYFCARVARFGRPRDYLWAGVWIGFALTCKISAAPLIVPLVVAHVYRGSGRRDYNEANGELRAIPSRRPLLPNPLLPLLALAAAAVSVFVTMPYAFIDFTHWWSDVWYQLQLAQGIQEQAFTRKFSDLPAYWYPLQQLIGWTMGLPLGLAAVAGVVAAVWRQARRRRGAETVLLAWVVVFFATTAGQYMKFLRYMLPLAPILTLFAAALLVAMWRLARPNVAREPAVAGYAGAMPAHLDSGTTGVSPALAPALAIPEPERAPIDSGVPAYTAGRLTARGWLARGLVVVAVALTVLYGLARENVYTTENTRLAATRWMAAHIPAGAAITVEDWDETLPIAPPGLAVPAYRPQTLAILGPGDGPTTVPMFVQALGSADYITISSDRVLGSVAHQPERYPYSIRWYDLLFGGQLNFRLVKSFKDPPHLGPFAIDDYPAVPRADQYTRTHLWYEADQNYSEYDAPPVYIFKRTGPVDATKAQALLTGNGRLAPAVAAYDPTHPMVLPSAVEKVDQKAPAYNSVFSPGNPLAQVPLLSWLLMVELLGLLALPLVMRACGGLLRDGGYALAKLGGIVVVGYVTWLAASLRVATYSRGLILGACLLLLLLSLAFGLRPRALWREVRARRRGVVWAEVVFLGAFLAFAAVRAAYPDLWHITFGGERTQEVSFTNAILRSQYFPPADPWFAGGTLNYYYYGQYLTGMLMKLSGIATPVGFNLALPTLYALMLSITFSIGYNATGRAWVGAAAAALEGVLGNLGMVGQFAKLAPTPAPASFLPVVAGLRDAVGGLVAVLTRQNGLQLPSDFFWGSSRILATPNGGDAINEFPIFSFTYGDMHAHVIDIPIVLGVILLALAVSGLGRERDDAAGSANVSPAPVPSGTATAYRDTPLLPPAQSLSVPTLLLLGALMAVVAGATGPTNLWDLPTSLILLAAGFALRGFFVLGRRGWPLILRDVILPAVPLGLASYLLYRPFYASVLGISSGFTALAPRTPTDQYLLHLGLPLFLLMSFLAVFLARQTRPWYWLQRLVTVVEFCLYYRDQWSRLPRLFRLVDALVRRRRVGDRPPTWLSLHLLLVGALLALAALLLGFLASTTLALIVCLVTLATIALVEACARAGRVSWQESQPFALALAVIGLTLTAIPDVVMQNEAGRMNTVFKLYNQAWPLLALSGALALAALIPPRRRPAPVETEERLPAAPAAMPVPAFSLGAAPVTQRLSLVTAAAGAGSLSSHVWSARVPDDVVEESVRRGGGAPASVTPAFDPGGTGIPPVPRDFENAGAPPVPVAPEAGMVSPPSANGHVVSVEAVAQPEEPDDEENVEIDPAVERDESVEEGDAVPVVAAAVPVRTVAAGNADGPRPRPAAALGGSWGWRGLWWAALAALVAGGALFPIFGTYAHLQLRGSWSQTAAAKIPTGLDGAAFVRALYPGDAAAIDWINGHITGMPVLLTSDRGDYRDFATKVTMLTGLPAVTAWDWEDKQERYSGQGRPAKNVPSVWVNQFESGRVTWNGKNWVTNLPRTPETAAGTRSADVEEMYNTPDPAQALTLLHEYHVGYIYVGIAERGDPNFAAWEVSPQGQGHSRAGFDPAGLAKFDRMAVAGQLRVVYRRLGVTIYKVVR